MEITIDMIEKVLDATDADYRTVKQALVDADGDVDVAVASIISSRQTPAAEEEEAAFDSAEESEESTKDEDASEGFSFEEAFTSDEYAEKIIDRLKRRIQEGNVDRIEVSKDDHVILNIPVNVGIVGGLLGLVTIPWALILGTLVAYGLNCKIEIVTRDGKSEEM